MAQYLAVIENWFGKAGQSWFCPGNVFHGILKLDMLEGHCHEMKIPFFTTSALSHSEPGF
jgi:hypothetical protein